MKIANLAILVGLCLVVYSVAKNLTRWIMIKIIDRKFQ